jgi:NADPH:quinone reductase-like Zn-dependent oxidoreductase
MKTMRLNDDVTSPALVAADVEIPRPGHSELLIRVYSAGVSPTELLWYPTRNQKDGSPRRGAVLGHEFSGVVADIGECATGFKKGQAIYGMSDWFLEGATAEYCLTQPGNIAPKPASLSYAEAASVPIGALTAWQGLFDRARLQPGEHVLIHGGSGAVGMYAIQLARRAGAKITTTASSRNTDFLKQLGADEVIDYRDARFDELLSNIDVVFDGVGGDTLKRSWSVLAPSGRLVTIAADSEYTQDERTKAAFFIVEPKQEQLLEIGRLFDAGELRAFVDAVVPFEEASSAYLNRVGHRMGRGKVVVSIAA